MKRTPDEIGNLIDYNRVNHIRALAPPSLKKDNIPGLISCQNYDKAKRKLEQTMERYNRKVTDCKAKVEGLKEQIEDLAKEIGYQTGDIPRPGLARLTGDTLKSTKPVPFVDTGEQRRRRAEKYNAILEVVRRLSHKKDALVDKHDEAVERHNEAVEEAAQILEELKAEALIAIDDDIVALFDRCTKTAERLSSSRNSEDLLVAFEIAFIELKLWHLLEPLIDSNAQRKECKERMVEVNGLFGKLCACEQVANQLAELFHRDIDLVKANAELYGQLCDAISRVDQGALDSLMRSLGEALGVEFTSHFDYEGTLDPSVLERIIDKMRDTIAAMNRNVAKTTELAASTKALAETALSADLSAKALFGTMKSNVQSMGKELFTPGYFACEVTEPALVDDFYHSDLRPAIVALRQKLVTAFRQDQVDALSATGEDRYSIGKAESAIQQANLLRLQAEREKCEAHVSKLTSMIAGLQSDIIKAGNVPQANSDAFRADASTKYMLSYIPVLGVIFAYGILGKVKRFEPAFRSTNRIYRDLACETLGKNAKMMSASLALVCCPLSPLKYCRLFFTGSLDLGEDFCPAGSPHIANRVQIARGQIGDNRLAQLVSAGEASRTDNIFA